MYFWPIKLSSPKSREPVLVLINVGSRHTVFPGALQLRLEGPRSVLGMRVS